jgi:hypothetical protein
METLCTAAGPKRAKLKWTGARAFDGSGQETFGNARLILRFQFRNLALDG